ncbi:Dyp-type peroxidase [Jiulongibacter sediminis]|uniref:Dyp-type peroxidase C-terminal domain-containing protein n=1 Tax=Jiulongibacter sediminis TaxID=1605367 RepID=A0A0P7C037_9BACT|nr:Dyp-type peroxidase [Jiulongibacter sediminis]KPM47885.1 hypothetical protein AFM12_11655 [Jiulongibacter sediminis]TBX24068.1 hypothetical protein TK44_11665 [Jiulongibacter sediminis]
MLINQYNPQLRSELEAIQGNILKGHGRKYTAHVFLKGKKGQRNSTAFWISELVNKEESVVKSGYQQLKANHLFKTQKIDGGLFGGFYISFEGYIFLEGKDKAQRLFSGNTSFINGMKRAALNDPEPSKWDEVYQENCHFMLLLADDSKSTLVNQVEKIKRETSSFLQTLHIEYGNAIFNKNKAAIEHFGYADGISQPLFFEDEFEKYLNDHRIRNLKDLKFDPRAEGKLVLVKDKFVDEPHSKGSFFVYRKLEQNVKGFKKAEAELAEKLHLIGVDEERVGAMIVGRFEDGTPVEVSGHEGMMGAERFNDFDYTFNGESKCPFHAHIRKTNPRNTEKEAADRRMARRGIPFGEYKPDIPIDEMPIGGVGLLFMSFQASLEDQFEHIQKNWANNSDFPQGKAYDKPGLDLIIGQGKSLAKGAYATEWGNPTSMKSADFNHFVSMRGGEYFFAPSMMYLKTINI